MRKLSSARNGWTVDLDELKHLGKQSVRFNARFVLFNDGVAVDEFFVIGLRLQYSFIALPTFGKQFPYPSVYLSTSHAEALVDVLAANLQIFCNVAEEELHLAPKPALMEKLTLSMEKYGRLFPEVAAAREFKIL